MAWDLTVVCIGLLGIRLFLVFPPTLSLTTPKSELPPRLIGCEFLDQANVTCNWENVATKATHYTLQVERRPAKVNTRNAPQMFYCTTSGTRCTAITRSPVRFTFCITVTAHAHGRNLSSQPRCQSGRIEVKLPPVPLDSVNTVRDRPECLNVTWRSILSVFPVSNSEVKAGNLQSQIEFTAESQSDVHIRDVTVRDYSFLACLFRPDTTYTIRLRHRYLGPKSPWSPWSNSTEGRTGEAAPSAAPALWRRVNQTVKSGWRLITLLWKPLPHSLANGRVLFYNVTCQTESTQVLNDHGSCTDLQNTSTFCSLRLPAERCTCSLTASTSAGTSPEARVWLLGAFEKEPPAPTHITATPVNESCLSIRWTAPVDRSASSFVVQWFAAREKSSIVVHWERLNVSSRAMVITEGVKPMERYVVSVIALYGERGSGQKESEHIYTRQGAPSAGPEVKVQQIYGSTVELVWSRVPVELLHGFVRNYTISFSTAGESVKRVLVPGHTHYYSLKNLLPGNHDIFVQAITDAGVGAAGPIVIVHISKGFNDFSVLLYIFLSPVLTVVTLVLLVCLVHTKIVKPKLCHNVPDPSHSSLAKWNPQLNLEPMVRPAEAEKAEIKFAEIVPLEESKLQNSEKDLTYQTYSSHICSPLPVSGTLQHTRKTLIQTLPMAETISHTDLSSDAMSYVCIQFPETLESPQTPLISPSYCCQSSDRQRSNMSIYEAQLPLGGGSELSMSLRGSGDAASVSPPSQAEELKAFHPEEKHQNPLSLIDFSSISHSSSLICHPDKVTSPQLPLSQRIYKSTPSLLPDLRTLPYILSDSFTPETSFSPHPVFVDFSYCPLE